MKGLASAKASPFIFPMSIPHATCTGLTNRNGASLAAPSFGNSVAAFSALHPVLEIPRQIV